MADSKVETSVEVSVKELKEKKKTEEAENGEDAAANGKADEENGEQENEVEDDVGEEEDDEDGEGDEEDDEDDDLDGPTGKRAAEDDDDDDEEVRKRTKLKPRSRRQISRVWPRPRCLDDDATERTDSQFSSKPSTPQSSLLNKNTFTNRISLYFYLHFIFL
ncbi:prothymosin alpha-A isoform X1 [Hippoglossus hippoglossus]|uniref:prothymosin alpha-A isoform X1 n=1 Tax=Hippoglossus hippoglossus TaxID=8267 RepID=UPI00148D729A|nr:prothymosin alpha-A isoform X1 [Hippoglossus hippoglossus]